MPDRATHLILLQVFSFPCLPVAIGAAALAHPVLSQSSAEAGLNTLHTSSIKGARCYEA